MNAAAALCSTAQYTNLQNNLQHIARGISLLSWQSQGTNLCSKIMQDEQ